MSGVRNVTVESAADGMRLDRWIREQIPGIGQGQVQKLLRTGQIRLDGKRAKANARIVAGQIVRIPPTGDGRPDQKERRTPPVAKSDEGLLADRILHMDDHIIAIDKPAGLAVQGGSGTSRHVDGLLDTLRHGHAERPRLVHRLDKDTSGVLLLARDRHTAKLLTKAFQTRQVRKLYWALTVGVPGLAEGTIDAPLRKARTGGPGSERMIVDEERGDRALTAYRTVAQASKTTAWLALEPLTGRTHQLRVHLAAIGTPILGDGKYGGADAHPDILGRRRQLQLHARGLMLEIDGLAPLSVAAEPPDHMRDLMSALELSDPENLSNFI